MRRELIPLTFQSGKALHIYHNVWARDIAYGMSPHTVMMIVLGDTLGDTKMLLSILTTGGLLQVLRGGVGPMAFRMHIVHIERKILNFKDIF